MSAILVVDDEMDLSAAVCAVLEEEGYRVVSAADGKAGIEQARATHPDVILMDVMMPVLSGLEALQTLKADPDLADIPVVLMSAVHLRPEFANQPIAGFLKKPFNIGTLLDLMERLTTQQSTSDV